MYLGFIMKVKTITITKKEYARLKKLEKLDRDLIKQFIRSFKDIKAGRIKRVL